MLRVVRLAAAGRAEQGHERARRGCPGTGRRARGPCRSAARRPGDGGRRRSSSTHRRCGAGSVRVGRGRQSAPRTEQLEADLRCHPVEVQRRPPASWRRCGASGSRCRSRRAGRIRVAVARDRGRRARPPRRARRASAAASAASSTSPPRATFTSTRPGSDAGQRLAIDHAAIIGGERRAQHQGVGLRQHLREGQDLELGIRARLDERVGRDRPQAEAPRTPGRHPGRSAPRPRSRAVLPRIRRMARRSLVLGGVPVALAASDGTAGPAAARPPAAA